MQKEIPKSAQGRIDLIEEMNREVQMLSQTRDKLKDRVEIRRIFVRSYFALIEAIVSLLLDSAKEAAYIYMLRSGIESFSDPDKLGELCALHDRDFMVTGKGDVKGRNLRVPLENRTLLAIRTFYQLLEIDQDPRLDSGWKAFKESIDLRHRITHPRPGQSIVVSDRDLKLVEDGYNWLVECYSYLTTSTQDKG